MANSGEFHMAIRKRSTDPVHGDRRRILSVEGRRATASEQITFTRRDKPGRPLKARRYLPQRPLDGRSVDAERDLQRRMRRPECFGHTEPAHYADGRLVVRLGDGDDPVHAKRREALLDARTGALRMRRRVRV